MSCGNCGSCLEGDPRPEVLDWAKEVLAQRDHPDYDQLIEALGLTGGLPVRDCDAEIAIGHETFGCLGGHALGASHEGIRRLPACASCGGYDEHSSSCATPDVIADGPDEVFSFPALAMA